MDTLRPAPKPCSADSPPPRPLWLLAEAHLPLPCIVASVTTRWTSPPPAPSCPPTTGCRCIRQASRQRCCPAWHLRRRTAAPSDDIEALVAEAPPPAFYTNLITSGVGSSLKPAWQRAQ